MTTREFALVDVDATWPPDERSIGSRRRVIATIVPLAAAGGLSDLAIRASMAGKRRGDALTLASAAIAIRRLALYDDAFGLTIPRFVAPAFAIWPGVVLSAAAIAFAGPRSGRRWLVPVLGALGCCGRPRSTSSIRRGL